MQALVTGAARRLGKAIALELHRAGHRVAVHYRTSRAEAEETAALLGGAPLVQGDQAAEPERIVLEAAQALGGLDLLVCSAAQFEKAPAESLSRARFEAMLAADLTGPFLLMQAALPLLRASRGSIVTLLDVCGTSQVWKGYAHYAAAKAGLAALTRLLALEWAPEVRVNGVAPGAVLLAAGTDPEGLQKRIPLGRIGKPEDVARAVRFLAQEPFITGEILTVDGGRSLNPWSSGGI
ncbi:MAG TPA: SDR family oxidoreductase [Myxococcales bacterium]|nr:SDR family oxidoreductase [Myxococcales bacterium]